MAQRLAIGATSLSFLLGVSAYDAGMVLAGRGDLEAGTAEFRNALRLVRLAAVLNVLFEDDRDRAVAWLHGFEAELGSTPWDLMIGSEEGFEEVVETATARARSMPLPRSH